VRYVGEADRDTLVRLLHDAIALVNPIEWPEPFGLVMIEAMACGTPVLGADMGSIPEIVVHGETGFLCADVDDAAARIPQLRSLDRAACRRRVETTFSTDRMIDRYAYAYRASGENRLPAPPAAEQLRWRAHDWWDRPMAYTDIPPRPQSFSADGTGA